MRGFLSYLPLQETDLVPASVVPPPIFIASPMWQEISIDMGGGATEAGTKSVYCSGREAAHFYIFTELVAQINICFDYWLPGYSVTHIGAKALISLLHRGHDARRFSSEWGNSRCLDSLAESTNPMAAACSAPCIRLG